MAGNAVWKLKIGIACAALASLLACQDAREQEFVGNWAYYEENIALGAPRSYGVGITLDTDGDGTQDMLYYGLGWNATSSASKSRLRDWWRMWEDGGTVRHARLQSFPTYTNGTEVVGVRQGAVAFTAGGKIYVGTGTDGVNYFKDFYCYDPATNTWTSKWQGENDMVNIPDLPVPENEIGRYEAVAFSINGKGYVGTGYSVHRDGSGVQKYSFNNDFYCYDPQSNSWSTIPGAGVKRRGGVVFVINGEAYLCTGQGEDGNAGDFHKYTPGDGGAIGKWTQLRNIYNHDNDRHATFDDDYINIRRYGAVGWAVEERDNNGNVVGGRGYLATGFGNSSTWEYNPAKDLWTRKTAFERNNRYGGFSFVLGTFGYVASGMSSNSSYFSDIWYFQPNAERNPLDNGPY